MGITDKPDSYDVEEIYVLTWENRPGAEVRARSIGTGEILDWSLRNARAREAAAEASDRTALRDASFTHMLETLAEVIVSWTLTRRGAALPVEDASEFEPGTPEYKAAIETNVASLRRIGHKLLLDIYKAYMESSAEVDEGSDLGKDSTSGAPYPEELGETELL